MIRFFSTISDHREILIFRCSNRGFRGHIMCRCSISGCESCDSNEQFIATWTASTKYLIEHVTQEGVYGPRYLPISHVVTSGLRRRNLLSVRRALLGWQRGTSIDRPCTQRIIRGLTWV
ncbi:hypothetical protein AAMO2058_000399600 [Amorphochlora amoebiformis]